MNGVHDLGGMHGMGPIRHEDRESPFHEPWEGRVYALARVLRTRTGLWGLDAFRHGLEVLPAVDYFRMSYYQRWFTWMLRTLVAAGDVTQTEIETGTPANGSPRQAVLVTPEAVSSMVDRRASARRDVAVAPGFKSGQRVRARNVHPSGHTRLPRYVRGRSGVVVRDRGVFLFPTRTRICSAKNRSISTPSDFPRATSGVNKPRCAISFTSTCGTTTWSMSDPRRAEPSPLAALPSLVPDEGGRVFADPWQAQAFALTVRLSAQGHFTWKEWAAALAHELRAAADRGEPDDGSRVLRTLGSGAGTSSHFQGFDGTDGTHTHAPSPTPPVGRWTLARRPLLVGAVHGLAGSGALTALVMATIPSIWARLIYLLLFGIGSTVGMAALSGAHGLAHCPRRRSRDRRTRHLSGGRMCLDRPRSVSGGCRSSFAARSSLQFTPESGYCVFSRLSRDFTSALADSRCVCTVGNIPAAN